MRVNLVLDKKQKPSINWTEIMIIIAFILLIMVMGILFFLFQLELNALEEKTANLDKQLAIFRAEEEEYNQLKEKLAGLEGILAKKNDKTQYKFYTSLLVDLGYILPNNVTVLNINMGGNEVIINAKAETNQNTMDFSKKLRNSPFYSNVALRNMNKSDYITFQIQAELSRRH